MALQRFPGQPAMACQRWLAPFVGLYRPIRAPSSRDSPTTSSSWPLAALTNVQVPSPVVDSVHCAAGSHAPAAASVTAPPDVLST